MIKEQFLKTKDNIKIAFRHYNNNRKKLVIIAHGSFSCKDTKPFTAMAQDMFCDYDVISFDFRGHGNSSGLFTFSSKEYKDLAAIIDYAKQSYSYSHIGVMGFSLGGTSSIIYASNNKDIDSIIAISAPMKFSNIEYYFWKYDLKYYLSKCVEVGKNPNLRPGNIFAKKIAPIDIIENNSIPMFFMSGLKDSIVCPRHSQEMFKKTKSKKQIEFFDSFHAEDLYRDYPEKFINLSKTWFEDTL